MSLSIQSSLKTYSKLNGVNQPRGNSASKTTSEKIKGQGSLDSGSMRKQEYLQRQQENTKSVVDQSISYASQLKASRTKSKQTSLEKKKLQYNFKKVSSQIVRSKNSVSARKAVQAAKREVMRLKRLKGSGEYDDEELQLAIDHAKSMEKVAKKKEAHLEQEEMVERAHKGFGAAIEEIEEKSEGENEENPEEELIDSEQELDVDDEFRPEYDYQYELELSMEEYGQLMQEIAASTDDAMSNMMEEFNQEMSEMMEDLDLTELTESLYAPDPNMSEEDLKMLKIKHRAKEMKEIAEADKEYLKGIMEHEKNRAQAVASGTMAGGSAGPSPIASVSSEAPKITPMISMPGAGGTHVAAPMIDGGGFSVSV